MDKNSTCKIMQWNEAVYYITIFGKFITQKIPKESLHEISFPKHHKLYLQQLKQAFLRKT